MVVGHGLDALPELLPPADRHRLERNLARAEAGGRTHEEAARDFLALVAEGEGDLGRLDGETGGRFQAHPDRGRALVVVPHRHAELAAGRCPQGEDRDLGGEPYGERGHDLENVLLLASDEGPLVAPEGRRLQPAGSAGDPVAQRGRDVGGAPGQRLVRGNVQVQPVRLRAAMPVGLGIARLLPHRDHESHAEALSSGEDRRRIPGGAPDRPSRGRTKIEPLDAHRPRSLVEERDGHAEGLAGHHLPIVHPGLEEETLGRGQGGEQVLLYLS